MLKGLIGTCEPQMFVSGKELLWLYVLLPRINQTTTHQTDQAKGIWPSDVFAHLQC